MKIFGEAATSNKPCPLCGKLGRPVGGKTVKHLLKEDCKDKVVQEAAFQLKPKKIKSLFEENRPWAVSLNKLFLSYSFPVQQ